MGEDLETATFNLSTANRDLDEYDKINREAELEISSLQRQVANKEESVDNTEARILMAQEKFAEASEAREDSERQRKVLESRCNLDGERIKKLEQQLQEASLGQRGRPRPFYRPPNSYFRDNSAIPPPQLMRGRACDLDVELGPAFNVTVEGTGLFVRPSLRDLSSNRRKPGWLQPLESLPLFSTKGSTAP